MAAERVVDVVMEVRLVTREGVRRYPVDDSTALLDGGEGLVWVDIPVCDEPAARVLSEVLGFHPRAVRDCVKRNRVPKVHIYTDHVFVVLHARNWARPATCTTSSWTSSSARATW
jgi:Mg2+ and Co2+ transporter CorA